MNTLRAELLKLTGSLAWVVVVLVPLTMVLSGVATTLTSGEPLDDGWRTLWLRSIVFHGLFPCAVVIASLASVVWRAEHRDGNWNALMAAPTSALRVVAAKAVVVAILAAAMQVVLLVTVALVGTLALGLPGPPPWEYAGLSAVIVVACVPVAVLQSTLSMLTRSFALPIGAAFAGAGLAVVLLVGGLDVPGLLVPQGLLARATQLGTGTFGDPGAVTSGDVVSVVLAATVQSALLVAAGAAVLRRIDVRT